MAFINPKTGFVYETPEERAPRITERQQNWTGLGLQSRGQDIVSRGQNLRDRQARAALAQRGQGMQMAHQLGLGGLADAAEGRRLQGRRLGLDETGAARAYELDQKGLTLAERQQAALERGARRQHRQNKGALELAKTALEQEGRLEVMRDATTQKGYDLSSSANILATLFGSGLTKSQQFQSLMQAEEWARAENAENAIKVAEINRKLKEKADGFMWWNDNLSDDEVVKDLLTEISEDPEDVYKYAKLVEGREGALTEPFTLIPRTGQEFLDKHGMNPNLEENVQGLRDLITMLQSVGSRGLGYPGQTQKVPSGDGGGSLADALTDAFYRNSSKIPGGAQ